MRPNYVLMRPTEKVSRTSATSGKNESRALPIVFRHPELPVGGKQSVFNFSHHHVRSSLLVSSIWQPACASSLRRRGRVKKPSPIFRIWAAIPSSILHTAPLKFVYKQENTFRKHLKKWMFWIFRKRYNSFHNSLSVNKNPLKTFLFFFVGGCCNVISWNVVL